MNKDVLAVTKELDSKQLQFNFATLDNEIILYEYAVLVTSCQDEVITIAQHLLRLQAPIAM